MVEPRPLLESPYWWSAYGPFPPGEGNMPHMGCVITAYRELKGWSVAQLASALGIERRQMYNLERSPDLPGPLPRRELLVRLLDIPPVLLGVLALHYVQEPEALPATTVDAYEGVLSLAWEAYYTSSAQRSATTVALWLSHLNSSIDGVNGIAQDQLRALLCRFYQLSGVIARDRLDFAGALQDAKKSIDLALYLRNAELVASSLYRRARCYVEMAEHELLVKGMEKGLEHAIPCYKLAVADLKRALPYAARSRDPLRCYVSICLAETYSLLAPSDTALQKESIKLLDDVGRTVRARGVLSGDGSFVKVDTAGLYMIRGDVLRRYGRLDDAQDALLIVRESLPKNFTRWQANLLTSEALLCHADRDIAGACALALDALDVLDETRSSSTRMKIERLHSQLVVDAPRHADVVQLEKRLKSPKE